MLARERSKGVFFIMGGNEEQLHAKQESNVEYKNTAKEQLEKLGNKLESSAESPRDVEARTEKARIEAIETAVSVEAGGIEKTKNTPTSTRRGSINKKVLNKSYHQTMNRVQSDLPVASRVFSKIIHNEVIEKTNAVLGSTIARPNAILAGSFFAFILTLSMYTVAKTIGYNLSGSETIAAFIIGWLVGIIYDYLRVLFTGKKF